MRRRQRLVGQQRRFVDMRKRPHRRSVDDQPVSGNDLWPQIVVKEVPPCRIARNDRIGDFRLDAGDQVIALGGIDAYEQKLDKLMSFYRKAVLYEGWDRYRYVNLKYKDQIVCVK